MQHPSYKSALAALLTGFSVLAFSACQPVTSSAAETVKAVAISTPKAAPKDAPWIGPLGWAEDVKGGAGGEIIKVTSLENEGPGTLREALAKEGPRTIVFEVGGVIDLEGQELRVNNPFVTIAGQTAPSPGITLIKGGFIVTGHDVIVQHVRVRTGDLGGAYRSGRDIDAFTTVAAHNVIVDHCSFSWATDENLSASGPRFTGETPEEWRKGTSYNIAYTNNIIAEGLSHATHAKGEHSKGSLIHDNVSNILIYGNLYAHNFERSPLFKGGVNGAVMNNFIYNPGQRAVHYNLQGLEWGDVPAQPGKMSLVGNVMRAGPSTVPGLPLFMLAGEGDIELYMDDNIAVDRWGHDGPVMGRYGIGRSKVELETEMPVTPPGVTPFAAIDVERYVLKNAGARPWDRDYNDVRVLADTAEGRGEIIDSQDQVGGYPSAKATKRAFNPEKWNLETMEPLSRDVLDSGSKAGGT